MMLGEQRPWTCGPNSPEAAVKPNPGSSQETHVGTHVLPFPGLRMAMSTPPK